TSSPPQPDRAVRAHLLARPGVERPPVAPARAGAPAGDARDDVRGPRRRHAPLGEDRRAGERASPRLMRVLTIGTFDLLHLGHVRLLKRAARFGELVVGVNSDRFVSEYRGRMPVDDEVKRMRYVEAIRPVSRVHLNDGPGRELIEEVAPDILVV